MLMVVGQRNEAAEHTEHAGARDQIFVLRAGRTVCRCLIGLRDHCSRTARNKNTRAVSAWFDAGAATRRQRLTDRVQAPHASRVALRAACLGNLLQELHGSRLAYMTGTSTEERLG